MALEIPEATEAAPCPLCGGTDGIVVGEKGRFGMPVRNLCCSTCATVYITPRPSAEAMAEYYRSTYRQHYGGVGYIGPDGVRAAPGDPGYEGALFHWHSPQADNALAITGTKAGARVLEIGCRHGKTLQLMRERGGILPFGVEPGENEAEQARQAGIDCFTGPLEAFDPGSKRFDQVQWFHVLEHVHEPLAALLKVRTLLEPDGTLLIEVPNVYQPYGPLEENFFQNVHLVSYSPLTLAALVRRAGFDVTRVVDAGALLLVAKPSALGDDVALPLAFDMAMLGPAPHDAAWVANRLGNYANLEHLSQFLKADMAPEQLTGTLLRCLAMPAFEVHLVNVAANFIEQLIARGHVDHALAVCLTIARGPHSADLRQQFSVFAQRLGAPQELLTAS